MYAAQSAALGMSDGLFKFSTERKGMLIFGSSVNLLSC
jgi:hypothetical protein